MAKRKRRCSDVLAFVNDLEKALGDENAGSLIHANQGSDCAPPGSLGNGFFMHTNSQPDEAMTNVALEKSTPASSNVESCPFMGLPPLQLIEGGLETVDKEALRQSLDPICRSLENLDAIAMLDLQRVENDGARVSDGLFVQPIHDQVMPVKHRSGSCVRYVHISEVPFKYSVGIFIFPPYARIPLHDHPGMCVLSRVLYGNLERISLDLPRDEKKVLEDKAAPTSSLFSWPYNNKTRELPLGSRQAYLQDKEQLQAPDVTVLFPYEGNLHEFTAGPHGAAVLDVLLPPYDEDEDRDCTFYEIKEDAKVPGPCWVIPITQPQDFHCLSGRYRDLGGDDDFSDDDEEADNDHVMDTSR